MIVGLASYGQATYEKEYNGGMGSNGLTSARHDVFAKYLAEKYPDLHNMEQLHRIRIKLKRFRYALQSVPELAPEARLLRSLKYLQDMLGLLHDDYINSLMVEKLVAAHPKIKELRYEAALFSGWEQAKADAALEALPQQWEAFSSQLTEWKNKNL